MASVEQALSLSEGFAISLSASAMSVERAELLTPLMQIRSWFKANRPMRERVSRYLASGVPWTQKEKLATVLTALGTYIAAEGLALAIAGKLTAVGVSIATAIGLTASAGPIVVLAIVALCAAVIFYAIGDLLDVMRGIKDWIGGEVASFG